MNDKLLYRIPEVAEHLSISRSKVYELLESGELRSVHIDSQPTRWVKTPVEVNGGPRRGVAPVEGWRAVVVHRAKSAALGRAHGRG